MLGLSIGLGIGTQQAVAGGGGGVAAMTWSPTDSHANNGTLTYSNGNLSVLGGTVQNAVRASRAVNYDKTYWEIHCDTGGASGLDEVAVADSLADMTVTWGSATDGFVTSAHAGVIYQVNGGITSYNGSRNTTAVSWIANDVIQTALDRVNGLVWFGKNNTWLNGTPGVSGGLSIVGIGSPLIPAGQWRSSTLTLNPGTTPGGTAGFTYTPPAGGGGFVAP